MELSSWIALVRSFQLVGALASATLNGFLIGLIYTQHLGLNGNMLDLELMISVLLLYTSVAIIVQHTGGRSRSTGWLVIFIVCDIIFCTLDIAIITVLAGAGLPSNCVGLTRTNFQYGDAPNDPGPGYTTVRFSNEASGQRGELDKYCGLERSFYCIAVGIVFHFMITVLLTVLRICEKLYTRNTRVAELLDSLRASNNNNIEEEKKLLSDVTGGSRASLSSKAASSSSHYHPPISEGIITRATSVRSAMTASTSTRSDAGSSSYAARPPVSPEPHPHPLSFVEPPPPAQMQVSSLPFQPGRIGAGMSPAALGSGPRFFGYGGNGCGIEGEREGVYDDGEETAQAALVADGMQHQPQSQSQLHQYQHQHQHQNQQQQQQQQIYRGPPLRDRVAAIPPRPHMPMPMPMVIEDEEHAARTAAVSDGMRPSEPSLPPYEPGSARMPGHADESNEMRLSEYVKGQTRAQDMKDSGGF